MTLILYVNSFWEGFLDGKDPVNVIFFIDLFELVFEKKIILGPAETADILIETFFGNQLMIGYKKWKYSFFFSGESQQRYPMDDRLIELYTCVLRSKHSYKNVVNVPEFIPYLYCYEKLNTGGNKVENKEERENKIPHKNIVAIISNGYSAERNYLLDELEKVFQIDYRGPFRNKNKDDIINEKYNTKEFQKIISEYKFILTLENSIDETYVTEKITHGFLAGIIPIYWGTPYVTECFNKNRFIILESFSKKDIDKVIEKIQFLSTHPEEYVKVVNQPYFSVNNKVSIKTIANEIKGLI